MKTITMYELLGLVKDGKAPKKIKCFNYNFIYTGDKRPQRFYKLVNQDNYLLKDFVYNLNTKVEIIEEEKKIPEKLEDRARFQYSEIPTWLEKKEIIKAINENFEKHQKAIYEIIDYLKSKGE